MLTGCRVKLPQNKVTFMRASVRRRLGISMLFLFPAFSSIHAADLMTKAPPPKTVPSWTGFYIGGIAGGAWGRDQVTSTLGAPAPFLPVDLTAISNAASPTLNPRG